ncbi:MAG: toxin-antitoxin system YwqK family antitoxin [Bacteroides sp.]|jgi:antitoxin component YwqK of YwqJK toxin-antitoxin module|nr:toxin-antitoxin system YwqK family antitoxin [Bacteroides sp.]
MIRVHKNIRNILFFLILFQAFPALSQGNGVNQRDEEGRRQGPWQGIFANGMLRYQGQFVNDIPQGTFRYFYPEGGLRAELHHDTSKDVVPAVYFHKNNQPMATGQFKNNQRTGLWRFFSESGIKLAETEYTEGQLEGKSITFFPSGEVAEIVEYSAGVKQGAWQQFYEDGKVRLLASYENNELNGPFKLFYEDGKEQLLANYSNNLPHDSWKFFTKEGELEKEVIYQHGIIVKEMIYIEREEEITIPLVPDSEASEDIFTSPF